MGEPNPTPPLRVTREGDVLVVTLDRPRQRNAIDTAMMEHLRALWVDAERIAGVRCVVVTGAAPGFCSGADMSLLGRAAHEVPDSAAAELSFLPGRQLECPVITAVNGVCAGGGLHFVADADIAIASSDSVFLDPHVSVGHVSALEPLTLWLRARPDAVARMALLGSAERLDADQARGAGLVSEVTAPDRVLDRAMELASAIAANSPAAVRATRRVLRDFEEHLLDLPLDAGWDAIRSHWEHPDSHEGPAAFREQRSPRWSDER